MPNNVLKFGMITLQGWPKPSGEGGRLRSGEVHPGERILQTDRPDACSACEVDGHREHDQGDIHHQKWRGW